MDESVEVVKRFFKVLEALKQAKILRGTKTFTDKYNINRRNLITLRKEPHRAGLLKMQWLSSLIVDFNVNAEWLLTGRGGMFSVLKLKSTNLITANNTKGEVKKLSKMKAKPKKKVTKTGIK